MAKLIWSLSSGTREHDLVSDVVLGRSSVADVVIEDETVSRQHSRIASTAGGWQIEDLGSGNGTILNGVVIQGATPLVDGDEVTLGRIRVVFRTSAVAPGSVVFSEAAGERLRSIEASSTATRESLDSDLLSTTARLQKIASIASAITQARNEPELFSLVADELFGIFPQAGRVCVILIDQSTGDFRPMLARSRNGSADQIPVSRTILNEVVRERRTVLSADAAADERFAGSGTVMQFSLRTLVCAPMIAGERVVGVIQIDGDEPGRPFVEDDLATLLVIAAQTALAIASNRTMQALAAQSMLTQDLALAKRIQTHLLPAQPHSIPNYSLESFYSPALAIGGDFFDVIRLNDTHHLMAIGDVSGKGISAALYMTRLGSELRQSSAGKTDAGDILRRLNKAFTRDLSDGMFVTMLIMVLNTAKDDVQVASAGHMSPILRKTTGASVVLHVPQNEPLGMPNYGGFEQEKFKIEPGEVLTVFTDGINEAMNEARALFGDQRLFHAIETAAPATPSGVRKSILAAVDHFCDGASQSDDITLLCFGRS